MGLFTKLQELVKRKPRDEESNVETQSTVGGILLRTRKGAKRVFSAIKAGVTGNRQGSTIPDSELTNEAKAELEGEVAQEGVLMRSRRRVKSLFSSVREGVTSKAHALTDVKSSIERNAKPAFKRLGSAIGGGIAKKEKQFIKWYTVGDESEGGSLNKEKLEPLGFNGNPKIE